MGREVPYRLISDWTHMPEEVQCLADDIYREDVVFRDPRNAFRGLKNYKTIFWSLRFHGRLFFKVLYVDVQRLWQPDDQQIKYGPSPALQPICVQALF